MKYVLELKDGRFYYGYTTQGPVLVDTKEEASKFSKKEYAENVLQGDDRFKGGKVVPVED